MVNIGAIRRALMDRIGPIPDTTLYAFIPDAVNVPCLFIEPDRPFMDYQIVMQYGGRANLKFVITFITNRIDEESAQAQVDDFLDPEGQVVANLQDRVDDALNDLVASVEVDYATRYGSYKVGGTNYFGVQLQITVMV